MGLVPTKFSADVRTVGQVRPVLFHSAMMVFVNMGEPALAPTTALVRMVGQAMTVARMCVVLLVLMAGTALGPIPAVAQVIFLEKIVPPTSVPAQVVNTELA